MKNYVALDVETANFNRDSICSISAIKFIDGAPEYHMTSLVDPQCEFFPFNVNIHGISYATVKNAPTWDIVYPAITEFLGDSTLVAHNAAFDRSCINRMSERYGLSTINNLWVCTAKSAKRALSLYNNRLPTVARSMNIEGLEHHNAYSDATTCGLIASAISDEVLDALGYRSHDWSPTHKQSSENSVEMDDSEGYNDLTGQTIVFTGNMTLFSREGAQNFVKSLGGKSPATVSGKTSLVVAGPGAGSKLEKAHTLNIPVMSEQEFASMVTKSDRD